MDDSIDEADGSASRDDGSFLNNDEWQADPYVVRVQRRAVRFLIGAQIVGGVGIGAAGALSALLAEAVTHSESLAGLARTSTTMGAAAVALPLALMARRKGRRAALAFGWTIAALGGIALVVASVTLNVALLVIGMLMFGCAQAVNLQSRYAAIDLALPARAGKTLSLVVWSTTFGSVVGPNLADPGAKVAGWFGLPSLSGGFLLSAIALVIGALLMLIFLRPDPLLTAQHYGLKDLPQAGKQGAVKVALTAAASSPLTRLAFVTIALGHTAMAAVMTMTPIHMMGHGSTLRLVGMAISFHVLGMYAFSPIVGILSDRVGRIPTILMGQGLFVLTGVFGLMAGSNTTMITITLFLVGLGWSFSLVAGSTLLAESVPANVRPAVQGVSDMVMNVAAGIIAGLSGVVMAFFGFAGLTVGAALLAIPVLVLIALLKRSRFDAAPV